MKNSGSFIISPLRLSDSINAVSFFEVNSSFENSQCTYCMPVSKHLLAIILPIKFATANELFLFELRIRLIELN